MSSNLNIYNEKNIKLLSDEILNRIDCIKFKIMAINYVMMYHHFSTCNIGVEELATYRLKDAWEKYSVLIDKVLFRMNGTIDTLVHLLDKLDRNVRGNTSEGKIFIPIPGDCYVLFYDFEAMIIAFNRLYEEELVRDLERYFNSSENKRIFRNNIPKKTDIEGLYWRIYLLRNRMAHSTGGRYRNNEFETKRFIDFSSVARMITICDGVPKIECNLIDLEKNPEIKNYIERIVINNKNSVNNVFNMLFSEQSPKGKGKDAPHLIIPNFKPFDYCDSLFSLSNQILDFISDECLVFLNDTIALCNEDIVHQNICYFDNNQEKLFSLNSIYDISTKQWRN